MRDCATAVATAAAVAVAMTVAVPVARPVASTVEHHGLLAFSGITTSTPHAPPHIPATPQLDELLAWAAEKNPRQGSKVPDDFIIAQFTRVDLDGSGGLDFNECLLLQYLGCLNMLWCGCCGAFIDMDKEDGVTCASCYGKFGSKDKPGERQLDLCIKVRGISLYQLLW